MIHNISFDDVLVRATASGRVAGRHDSITSGATLGSVSVPRLLAMLYGDDINAFPLSIPRIDLSAIQATIRIYQQETSHGDNTYI